MKKIWVEKDWYIPVNDEGYVIGPCFEGMMGCVLQIKQPRPEGIEAKEAKAAMKIPRLLADTVEENAYICKMTEDEEKAVQQIHDAGGKTAYLLDAQFFGTNPLRLRRSTEYSVHEEAKAQRGHVIFVYFERDEKPRFCSVNFDKEAAAAAGETDGLLVFPQNCKAEIKEKLSEDDWLYFIRLTQNDGQPEFSRTVYRWQNLRERAPRGDLIKELGTQQVASIWYAAIPSIVFDWAEGNLQEAITKQELNEWSFGVHPKSETTS